MKNEYDGWQACTLQVAWPADVHVCHVGRIQLQRHAAVCMHPAILRNGLNVQAVG